MTPEINVAPATSQKRIEANRRNAQKSTGPRTDEGKNRARFNAVKHGLTAQTAVLPGEDPAELAARVEAMAESFGPRNQVEAELLHRVATTTWSLERAARAEAAQLTSRIRRDTIERQEREQDEALLLGQRLLWDARGPWQFYPHNTFMGTSTHRRISWSENPADPNSPALLLCRLERTGAGCRWLVDRWAELRARLEPGEVWTASDQFKAVRLLGRQPLDAVEDDRVALIFLAGAKFPPEDASAKPFAPLQSELQAGGTEYGIYLKELRKRKLAELTPQDAETARRVLQELVDGQIARLERLLRRNQEIAEADAAVAPDRLAFDPSPEADKLRRYSLSAARLVNQTLTTLIKLRKDSPTAGSTLPDDPPRSQPALASPGPISQELSIFDAPWMVVAEDGRGGRVSCGILGYPESTPANCARGESIELGATGSEPRVSIDAELHGFAQFREREPASEPDSAMPRTEPRPASEPDSAMPRTEPRPASQPDSAMPRTEPRPASEPDSEQGAGGGGPSIVEGRPRCDETNPNWRNAGQCRADAPRDVVRGHDPHFLSSQRRKRSRAGNREEKKTRPGVHLQHKRAAEARPNSPQKPSAADRKIDLMPRPRQH
jgi:hypothetical protein